MFSLLTVVGWIQRTFTAFVPLAAALRLEGADILNVRPAPHEQLAVHEPVHDMVVVCRIVEMSGSSNRRPRARGMNTT
ncbi:hypothetical protein WME79_47805 [Sorangium sp. So ce726]|uniref:hypothetical protein n=1 Tax=Sorangium sp. So ce726 TaxID=3133319 RepID=UPI003F60CCB5